MFDLFGGDALLAEAAKQGLWAILYLSLFVYTLRESRRQQDIAKERENRMREEYQELRHESGERENKLTEFIHTMGRQFERLATQYEKIAEDVKEIRIELSNKQDKNPKDKGE